MPSPECQMARLPEQVRRQRTVGNSPGEFATLALPRVTSSGEDSKAANSRKQSDCDRAQDSDLLQLLRDAKRRRIDLLAVTPCHQAMLGVEGLVVTAIDAKAAEQ